MSGYGRYIFRPLRGRVGVHQTDPRLPNHELLSQRRPGRGADALRREPALLLCAPPPDVSVTIAGHPILRLRSPIRYIDSWRSYFPEHYLGSRLRHTAGFGASTPARQLLLKTRRIDGNPTVERDIVHMACRPHPNAHARDITMLPARLLQRELRPAHDGSSFTAVGTFSSSS